MSAPLTPRAQDDVVRAYRARLPKRTEPATTGTAGTQAKPAPGPVQN